MTTKQALIKRLQTAFPKLDVRDGSEFYGHAANCIWMPNAAYDFNLKGMEEKGDNELNDFIVKHGWHVQPYDCETMLAYE